MQIKEYVGYLDKQAAEKKKQDKAIKRKESEAIKTKQRTKDKK